MLEEFVRSGQHAGDIRADGHEVAAHGGQVEHFVKAGCAPHFCGCQLDELRYVLDPLRAEIAVLLLEHVQRRDQSGTFVRVKRD